MVHDIDMLRAFYSAYPHRVEHVRQHLQRPLTLSEKILYAHLSGHDGLHAYRRGHDYGTFSPDRVAMQDATAQMALLQFMNAGREASAVPATIHCDHLIMAADGAEKDLPAARAANAEIYEFLASAAARYHMGFWPAGEGIIHQVVLEHYAFPGGMMVGTDSHTPNAGGLGMLAVGVGGADAVDVMAGLPWELKVPCIIGVRLTGRLSAWASPKDVILKLAGMLTVKGGTNAIIEYFGPGCEALSCTGKATICNMGAEVGATCSVFPYDVRMSTYLRATGRGEVADMADNVTACLHADFDVLVHPEAHYDQVLEIDLSKLQPHVNGPFTPDAACEVGLMAQRVAEEGFPPQVSAVLIGSCTNSSYQDLARAASVARAALDAGLRPKAELIVNPGSEQIRATAERDGLLGTLREAGAVVMTNACGPCIGQWARKTSDPTGRNSIVTTFNRNFAKRADGNPNTHAFITSPELAMGFCFTGNLTANPTELLPAPKGNELPSKGFVSASEAENDGGAEAAATEVVIRPGSERLQRLEPFAPNQAACFCGLHLLIKTKGKCTTDHISMAGPWLRYRGHLKNISRNLLMGAVNAFNGQANAVTNVLTGEVGTVADAAQYYKEHAHGSFVVAEENYGEGSSREHAAMEPRYLDVRFILAKSFARIHETNLKKQGVLALTFANPDDYDIVEETDTATVTDLDSFRPGAPLTIRLTHADGSSHDIVATHTYNAQQVAWFRAGSALNAR